MGCTISLPRAKGDQVADEVAQAKPSNKQLSPQPVTLDFSTSLDSTGFNGVEKTGARDSSDNYKIRAEDGAGANAGTLLPATGSRDSTDNRTTSLPGTYSPQSARSTSSTLASTVVPGGRGSGTQSFPQTPAALMETDEPESGVTVTRKPSTAPVVPGARKASRLGLLASGVTGSKPPESSITDLSQPNNAAPISVANGENEPPASSGRRISTKAPSELPTSPVSRPDELKLDKTAQSALLNKDIFKKAAYLSSGSLDQRPTYQRDAVDDDFSGAGTSGSDGVNVFNWKDIALGKPPVPGAAFGSMVMPHFKGARKAHRLRAPMANMQAGMESQTSEASSVSMNGWADMSNSGTSGAEVGGAWSKGSEALPASHQGDRMRTSAIGAHELGSIAGWQAIADMVLEEGLEEDAASSMSDSDAALADALADEDEGSLTATQRRDAHLAKMTKTMHLPRVEPDIKSRAQGLFYVNYELQGQLGEGAFGEARLARRRKDGKLFVVKIMHGAALTEKAKEEARNEVRVLASLDHPNIVKYYETFVDEKDSKLQIVMELCEEGDLDTFVKNRSGELLEEDNVLLKFVQICLGLQHVHSKGIIHRDLKGNNIFCCANGILKLGDFGISKVLTPDARAARTMIGTPYYMSPEILKGKSYDMKTDVWAIGCILYELCSLKKAFDGGNLGAITVKVMSGKFPPIPNHYSSEMKALVNALIQREPSNRPTLEEVVQLEIVRRGLSLYQEHIAKNKLQQSLHRAMLGNAGSVDMDLTMSSAYGQGSTGAFGKTMSLSASELGAISSASSTVAEVMDPDTLKARHEAEERAAAEARKTADTIRRVELDRLRAAEEAAVMESLRRFKQGLPLQPVVFVPPPSVVSVATPSSPTSPARKSRPPSSPLKNNNSKRSRFSPRSTHDVASSAASSPQKATAARTARLAETMARKAAVGKTMKIGTKQSSHGLGPDGATAAVSSVPAAEEMQLRATNGSGSFNSGEAEETDDVDVLVDTEAPHPPALPGPASLLSQIQSLLQLPIISQLPASTEIQPARPARRVTQLDDRGHE